MKTDHELETLLRATLATRAESVRQGAPWTSPTETSRHRRWLPVLAAAAAVVLLAVGLAVGPRLVGNDHPAHPNPTRSGTPGPTTPHPTATPAPVATACVTPLPAAWRQAIQNSRVDLGAMAATLDDVAPDGTLVVSRDFGVTPGSARDIVLVSPGKAPRVVYRVTDPDRYDATAALDGHWLMIAINSRGRAPANTVSNFPPPTIYRLLLRDLNTGTTRQIASAPQGSGAAQVPLIEAFTVLDGRVYWTYRSSYGSPTGVVRSYDPRTGKNTTVYRGSLSDYPQVTSAGIGSYVAPVLPAQVAENLDPTNPLAVGTDGRAWAWLKSAFVLGWWQPGMSVPRYVQMRQAVSGNDGPPSVAGPYVFIRQQVVDVNTHALAALPADGKFASFEPQAGHDGVLYGLEYAGTGHWADGYWQDPQPQVQRVDTRALAALRC